MVRLNIIDYLAQLQFDYKPLLSRFIELGDKTAVRNMNNQSYRRNYERGLLLVAIANWFKSNAFLEFGTGRGYVVGCVADMCENVTNITTIDNESTDSAAEMLRSLRVNIGRINFVKADISTLEDGAVTGRYDLTFIDAIHTGEAVEKDYKFFQRKSSVPHVVVFDDYRNLFPCVKTAINKLEDRFDKCYLIHTDGWIIENTMIGSAPDADVVIGGKEHESGMVVGVKGYDFSIM